MDRLIYHIKALSVVIRTTQKICQNVDPVLRNSGFNFLDFRANNASEQALNSLFLLNIGLKKLVLLK